MAASRFWTFIFISRSLYSYDALPNYTVLVFTGLQIIVDNHNYDVPPANNNFLDVSISSVKVKLEYEVRKSRANFKRMRQMIAEDREVFYYFPLFLCTRNKIIIKFIFRIIKPSVSGIYTSLTSAYTQVIQPIF